MKENIKELKKGLFHGLGILIILSVGGLAFWLVKSRTATDPDLGDNGSSLYTSVNETLTAAKRNALVKSTKRVDVPTSDTALFDTGCERRRRAKNSDLNFVSFYSTMNNYGGTRINNSVGSLSRTIYNTAKSTISTADGKTRTMLKLQKKCQ